MSKIQPYVVQDESGAAYTVYIQIDDDDLPVNTPKKVTHSDDFLEGDQPYGDNTPRSGDQPRSTVTKATLVQLREINGTIHTYAKFVIDAFKNMGGAEVKELNFKFGLKFSGGAKVPVLVKGSAESNFEVEVKCTFPPADPK